MTRTPAEAIARAHELLGKGYPYILGAGNHRGPTQVRRKDGTLTPLGFDCWAFADAWAYEQPRHEPGFNHGPHATVSDDRNCDSAIEEAEHFGKKYEVIETPETGCLIVMPSVRAREVWPDDARALPDAEFKAKHGYAKNDRVRIGHVWLAVIVPESWDPTKPQYDLITTLQCQASSAPAIKMGPGPRYDGRSCRGLTNDAWRLRMLRVIG